MDGDNLYFLTELIQPFTFILVSFVGWGVRSIWKKVSETEKKIEEMRLEIHEELKEYTRKETCSAHRLDIQRQIDHLRGMRRVEYECINDSYKF